MSGVSQYMYMCACLIKLVCLGHNRRRVPWPDPPSFPPLSAVWPQQHEQWRPLCAAAPPPSLQRGAPRRGGRGGRGGGEGGREGRRGGREGGGENIAEGNGGGREGGRGENTVEREGGRIHVYTAEGEGGGRSNY